MSSAAETLRAPQHRYADLASLQDDFVARGWSDGLPIIPPTPQLVASFLERVGQKPDDEIGIVTTRDILISAEHVAIAAVMAGCTVDYMPVVYAGARALLSEGANLHCVSATLAGAQQVFFVNGPIRDKLNINYGLGAFGPGWRANATIGRALRLLVRNAACTVPGFLDRAVNSSPGRYSFCFGENEAASPWEPYHVSRGFKATDSTITLYSVMPPIEQITHEVDPRIILDDLLAWLRLAGQLWLPVAGMGFVELLLALTPDCAKLFGDAGMSRDDVRAYLWERLKGTIGETSLGRGHPIRLRGPHDIHPIVAGGHGIRAITYFAPHCALLVSERIED